MIGFLNEHSLDPHGDWSAFLRFFFRAAQELAPAAAVLFKDSGFFSRNTVRQQFNSLAFPKDERALIKELVFGTRYYRCWRLDRISNATDRFICASPVLEVFDASICEAAERNMAGTAPSVTLLTAPGSDFGGTSPLQLLKVSSQQTIRLLNAASLRAIRAWVASQGGVYHLNSVSAPRDFQTVLYKDNQRFRDTGKIERRFSRSIFEEIETGRLYYVDEGHPGNSAHLEVFSANGKHLGTSDIASGTLNISGRVKGRRLRL